MDTFIKLFKLFIDTGINLTELRLYQAATSLHRFIFNKGNFFKVVNITDLNYVLIDWGKGGF